MEPCRECVNECDASDTRSRSGTAALLKLPLRLHEKIQQRLGQSHYGISAANSVKV
jgi:hypothetical protein